MARKSANTPYYNSLVRILQRTSMADIKRFRDFIKSPYHNKSKKIILFFEQLLKLYPDFNIDMLNKGFFAKKLKRYSISNDSTFRHLAGDISRIFEKFLVFEKVESDKCLWHDLLFEKIYETNLHDVLGNRVKKFEKFTRKNIKIDSLSLISLYNIEGSILNFFSGNISDNKKINEHKMEIRKKRHNYLLLFYLVEMVKELDEMENIRLQSGLSVEKTFPVLSDKMKLIEQMFEMHSQLYGKGDFTPASQVYYSLYKLTVTPSNSLYYSDYKNLLLKYEERFSVSELTYLFNKLIEINLIRLTRYYSGIRLRREIMKIYSLILEKGYYDKIFGKYMPIEIYRNILVISLSLKMFDWSNNFIVNFNNKIIPGERKNIQQYSLSMLAFEKEEYEKALNYINKINPQRTSLKLDIKNILLKLYFIMDYNESAISLLDSYKTFLQNNRSISADRKIRHQNFLKVVKQLIKYKSEPAKIDLESISDYISKSPYLIHRKWLVDNIDNLRKNREIAVKK